MSNLQRKITWTITLRQKRNLHIIIFTANIVNVHCELTIFNNIDNVNNINCEYSENIVLYFSVH